MADDPPATEVTVTITGASVSITAPGADMHAVTDRALAALRDLHAMERARPGPAIGYALERDGGLDVHRDKRVGGDIAPVRAEATDA